MEESKIEKTLAYKNEQLELREKEFTDQAEELLAQKEELTAAIEELMAKNKTLDQTVIQLQDRNFELDQILYRTSHDLRTPVTSIKGILNLLKLEPQSDTIKEYLLHLENKTGQMENLLGSLSSLSKALLEDPVVSIVPLNKIIDDVLLKFRSLPNFSKITITRALQQPEIKSDYYLITILFQSLLANAFIFRNPLNEGKIIIDSIIKNERIEISISDDGEGISPNVLNHIFDMFYRGSVRSQGSGLGLYLAKNAAQRLSGTIHISFEDSMTRFTIDLPYSPPPNSSLVKLG